MKLLEITNIGHNKGQENLDKILKLSPLDKLDLYYILPNYSSLKQSRDYIIEKTGIVASDHILSIDDLVDLYKDDRTYYLQREVIVFLIKNILKKNQMEENLALEVSEYILDLKAQNIDTDEFIAKSKGYKDLEDIGIIYKAYEDYLACQDLKDQMDKYKDAGKKLEDIAGKKFIFNGFIEFREEEWQIIKGLSKNNDLIIQYPFASQRPNIKTNKMRKRAKELDFEIQEEIHIDGANQDIAYKYLLSPTSKSLEVGKISCKKSYEELKEVIGFVKEDLKVYEPQDISIIIPKEYEELIKIIAQEEGLNISSLNEKSGKNLPLIRAFLNFLHYIEIDDKDSLLTFLENSYINNYQIDLEVIDELRALNYKGIEAEYEDISEKLKDLLARVLDLVKAVKNEPVKNLKKYLQSLNIRDKLLELISSDSKLTYFLDSKKALELIEDCLDKVEEICEYLDLSSHDEFSLLKELIENSSYYDRNFYEGVQVLENINALGNINKKRYICGLNLDYPKVKNPSYLYSSSFSKVYKDLSFKFEKDQEYLDNEILKFTSGLTQCQELVFSYTENEGGYSSFLRALEKDLIYKDEKIHKNLYYKLEKDLFSRKEEINYLRQEQVDELNDLFASKLARLKKDPKYWGNIGPDKSRIGAYSAKMLDNLNQCPFKFMIDYIFELKFLETDYRDSFSIDKGNLYHRILREFFEKHKNLKDMNLDQINNGLSEIIYNLDQYIENWEISKEIINNILFEFILACQDQLKKLDTDFLPKYFERRFYQRIGNVNIYGDIDRLDESSDGGLLIYDYKTKYSPNIGQVLELEDLQLPIYLMLVGDKGLGAFYGKIEEGEILKVFYLEDIDQKSKSKGKMSLDQLEDYKIQIEKKIFDLNDRVEDGNFMVDPLNEDKCKYCDHQNICRLEDI